MYSNLITPYNSHLSFYDNALNMDRFTAYAYKEIVHEFCEVPLLVTNVSSGFITSQALKV
jgi:hypothetical protein